MTRRPLPCDNARTPHPGRGLPRPPSGVLPRWPLNDTFSGGLIGGVITAICFGAVLIVNALYKNRREDRAERHTADEAVIERQEKRIALLERTLEGHQGVVNRIVERHVACREENAELRAYGNVMRDRVQRCQDSCELGRKWGPVPPVPPPRPRPPEDAEFLARTAAQDVALARDVGRKLRRQDPPDPGGLGT